MNADVVFEGSGVKGIGIVGAICYFEEKGYTWKRVAGSSSGSITAALIAAGYRGRDLKRIFLNLDYSGFQDKTKLQSVPIIGKGLGVLYEKGMYSGDELENWVSKILKAAGKTKFKDVSINGESRLKIIASDITRKKMIVLPEDLVEYGIDPMEFEICKAVRMSCTLPLYFKPYELEHKHNVSNIIDGGILSNFPVWLFDTKGTPRWPTFGFKIVEPPKSASPGKNNVLSYIQDIVDTVIEQNEVSYIKNSDLVRTVTIPSIGIKTTDFDISKENSLMLYNVGYKSAEHFYKKWDFEKYIKMYRTTRVPSRRDLLMK
jgi:NTE family protein